MASRKEGYVYKETNRHEVIRDSPQFSLTQYVNEIALLQLQIITLGWW